MRPVILALGVASLALTLACQSIPDAAKQDLARPVDCKTAHEDIARLEAEKVSVAAQAAAGVRTIMPAAAVIGILRRDMKDRVRVATGTYNGDLDEKIFQIRQQCGVPAGQLNAEGLMEIEHAKVGFAAVKPLTDFSKYDQLMLLPVGMSFKKGSRELSAERVDDLRRYFHEEFQKELQTKGSYSLVSQAGPGVLLIRPGLANIDITVPVESGRDDVYVSDAGEVTLIVELRDSESGELLARAADRRKVSSPGGAYESNPVTNVANTRRLFRQWASLLRERLDAAHELKAARE